MQIACASKTFLYPCSPETLLTLAPCPPPTDEAHDALWNVMTAVKLTQTEMNVIANKCGLVTDVSKGFTVVIVLSIVIPVLIIVSVAFVIYMKKRRERRKVTISHQDESKSVRCSTRCSTINQTCEAALKRYTGANTQDDVS